MSWQPYWCDGHSPVTLQWPLLPLKWLLIWYSRQQNYSSICDVLAIFLWFDCQFLSFHACYKQYEAQRSWLDKYLFYKTALNMSFLTRTISSARIILLPTVLLKNYLIKLKILKKGADSQLKMFPKNIVTYMLWFAFSCVLWYIFLNHELLLHHYYIEYWTTVKCWFEQQFRCESWVGLYL